MSGILIIGLRRSGTTIFWETFRRDNRTLCYDEPFHPALWEGVKENAKGTWPELGHLWQRLGSPPVEGAAPIFPLDELDRTVTFQQREYLNLLFQQKQFVVADVVRAWNKLPSLLLATPDILIVHLVRSPIGWVTAHLLPSGSGSWRFQLNNIFRRVSFFRRSGQFNNWHYEEIIKEGLRHDHAIFRRLTHDTKHISRQPAYKKLLAFWWAVVQQVDHDLRRLSGARFMTVTLEEFSIAPGSVMERVYSRARWPTLSLDYEHVRSVNPGWQLGSARWGEAFEWAGIPSELTPAGDFTSMKFDRVLDGLASTNDHLS